MKVLLTVCTGWYLDQTAAGLEALNALGGLWIGNKNATQVSRNLYARCWPFHLAMKPFYHMAPQFLTEKAIYVFSGVYRQWLKSKLAARNCPKFDVVHGIMGFAKEAFEYAEKNGALKVLDCPNSHPVTQYGYWQRECDIWGPHENVTIPRWVYGEMNRDLEKADMVLCPSDFVRDTMVQNGIPREKCFVNPFGVDTGIFKNRLAIPPTPRFVCVGTICLRKGHQYLFRAFKELKQHLPQAELICVGDVKSDFRKEWPLWEGTFTHFPHLSHPELAELLKSCYAFVLASVEEGFARVISESMCAGLPIVATYESGAGTIVKDGIHGFIVNSRKPRELAEAMLKLAKNPSLCEQMGKACHEVISTSNTWKDYSVRLVAEYSRRLALKAARI
jgi:glycosyltransferase involved in cell wall biosynthesis